MYFRTTMVDKIDKKSSIVIDKHYRILDKIGKGGFASIYLVKDTKDREYALKVLCSKKRGIPCLMEPSIMMSYTHPYLNSALKVEVKGDMLFIFQNVSIDNLYNWSKENTLTRETIVYISYSILKAIDFLHKEGIMHGDIKASNILVFPDGIFKLTDFNLSCTIGWTSRVDICSANMRPLEGWISEWNETVDIWAFGCTLYYLLYGTPLFLRQTYDKYTHIKYVNALFDWQDYIIEHGGNKYPGSVTRHDINKSFIGIDIEYRKPYIEENLFEQNDLLITMLISMLRMDPGLRPTTEECLEYSFFDSLHKLSTVANIKRLYELPMPRKKDRPPLIEPTDLIYNIVKPTSSGRMYEYTNIVNMAAMCQRIYDRYISLKPPEYEDHIVCVTILWIARKLVHYTDHTYKLPFCANGLNFHKICEIERDIFRKLGSMLH